VNKVKIGVIGTGMVAQVRHLPELAANKNVEIVALSDKNSQRASSVGKKYKIKDIYSGDYGWQELVKRNDIDGVVISVPNYLHTKMACTLLRAKKHVLVEKPIAASLEEADKMINAAEKEKVILMVAHNQRFTPYYKMVKSLIEKNVLGKVNIIRMIQGRAGPASWVPEYWSEESNWFFKRKEAGGGALLDVGIHVADLLLWLVGKKVSKVQGFTQTLVKEIKLEDCAVCSMEFEDKTLAEFQVGWIFKPPHNKVAVHCENGTIDVDANTENPVIFYTTEPIEGKFIASISKPKINKAGATYSGVADHFIECIQGGKEPLTSGKESRNALEVILASYKSAKEGKVIKLPLKN